MYIRNSAVAVQSNEPTNLPAAATGSREDPSVVSELDDEIQGNSGGDCAIGGGGAG